MLDKAYIVVDSHLSHGAKLAQSGHALAELILRFPQEAEQWNSYTNVLIVLETHDIVETEKRLKYSDINLRARFLEPDFNYNLTAFAAFETDGRLGNCLADLPLANSIHVPRYVEWWRRKQESHLRNLSRIRTDDYV